MVQLFLSLTTLFLILICCVEHKKITKRVSEMIELCVELMCTGKSAFRREVSASVKGTPGGNLLNFC
jgi:hypothetical protein